MLCRLVVLLYFPHLFGVPKVVSISVLLYVPLLVAVYKLHLLVECTSHLPLELLGS